MHDRCCAARRTHAVNVRTNATQRHPNPFRCHRQAWDSSRLSAGLQGGREGGGPRIGSDSDEGHKRTVPETVVGTQGPSGTDREAASAKANAAPGYPPRPRLADNGAGLATAQRRSLNRAVPGEGPNPRHSTRIKPHTPAEWKVQCQVTGRLQATPKTRERGEKGPGLADARQKTSRKMSRTNSQKGQ